MSKADDVERSASSSVETATNQEAAESAYQRTRAFLAEAIDSEHAALPLECYCFFTGYISGVSYTAVKVWCAFQTGNSVQLSIALARTFSGRYAPTSGLGLIDGMALCSVLSFLAGAAFQQVGVRLKIMGTRGWHLFATLLCALLTFIAAMLQLNPQAHGQGVFADGNDLGWTGARGLATLGLLAGSMGLQGAVAKRMNTSFATSVVLTSVWIDLVANPNIFTPKRIKSRDQRVYAIALLFAGGFASRAILGGIATAGTLGIGAGLRAVSAFTWLLPPAALKKGT